MLKLRRIAPLVAGVTVVGGVVAQTAPADAATHSVTCGSYVLCLWYSSGSGSGIWRTDQSIVWSNFSYDYVLPKTPTYDHFTGGRFRHGTSILRWRSDKRPDQCTMDQVEQKLARRLVRDILANAQGDRLERDGLS